jgi:hypothetical protein
MNELPPKMSMDIASPPDKEKLVAEIFYEHTQWAEIHQELGGLTLELYPRQDGRPWSFSFHDAVAALQIASRRLLGDADAPVSPESNPNA